jgi:hypothetical protein
MASKRPFAQRILIVFSTDDDDRPWPVLTEYRSGGASLEEHLVSSELSRELDHRAA